MDRPLVQYAQTADGTSIAYWAIGSGPPVVICTPIVGHIGRVWDDPLMRDFFERLAEDRSVVRFDFRGGGASDHSPSHYGLADQTEALAVVLDRLPDGPADLLANNTAVGPAIQLAVAQPDRVGHLLLLEPFELTLLGKAGIVAAEVDTDSGADLLAMNTRGFDGGEHLLEFASYVRAGFAARDPDAVSTMFGFEPGDLLEQLSVPTIVISSDHFAGDDPARVRAIAARIPGARRASVERHWFMGAHDQWLQLINGFCGLPGDTDAAAETPLTPGAFRTLLFTDLESSTALTQTLGDAKAQEILHGHNDAVRAALAAYAGEEVKHTGDGIFAAFGSAVSAVEAALQIQRDLAAAEVRVRIGLNAGEPIAEDDDYFGTAVQLAARVCDRAEPGQVLVSDVVRQLCAGKLFTFTDQGEATLKGFDEAVTLYAVAQGGGSEPE